MTPRGALLVDIDRPVKSASSLHTLRTLVLGLLVAVPLVFDPREGHAGGRPRYLLLLVGAVVAGALLVLGAFAGRVPRRRNGLWWPVLGLVAWTGLSAAGSDHPRTVLSGYPGSYDGLWATAAYAVLFFAVVAAFRPGHVRPALTALWFGAGTGVLAFGLGQLLDRLLSPGSGWDWARPSIAPWTIGSTLGNPNHLASFLAILLPVGVVLAVLGGRRARAAVLAVGALVVAELVVTASRGGLAATVAGMAVLAVLFRRELRGRRSLVLRAAGAAAALALVTTVVLGAAGATKRDLGALVNAGPGSTVDVRREVWATAWRVAADHPVVGVGPDAFAVVFPAYASDRFRELFGPFAIANGAHNVFLNTLANLGAGGLVAFVLVVVMATRSMARTWTNLSRGPDDPAVAAELRERRLLLGGVAAALAAYLVQASFNTQDVTLSLSFWALLGLAVAIGQPSPDVR